MLTAIRGAPPHPPTLFDQGGGSAHRAATVPPVPVENGESPDHDPQVGRTRFGKAELAHWHQGVVWQWLTARGCDSEVGNAVCSQAQEHPIAGIRRGCAVIGLSRSQVARAEPLDHLAAGRCPIDQHPLAGQHRDSGGGVEPLLPNPLDVRPALATRVERSIGQRQGWLHKPHPMQPCDADPARWASEADDCAGRRLLSDQILGPAQIVVTSVTSVGQEDKSGTDAAHIASGQTGPRGPVQHQLGGVGAVG